MNRRNFITLLAAAATTGTGLAWWLRSDPRDREIRRIRTRLHNLATDLSFTEKDPPFARLGYADRITRYFHDRVDLDLAIGQYAASESLPRSRLPEGLVGLRLNNRGLSVEFIDIAVDLPDDALDPAAELPHASAHLTSKIYFTGERDYWVQEFRINLVRHQGTWLVRGVSTVRTMER